MKKNFVNQVNLLGYLYQHNLELRTVQDKNSANFGKEYITGTVEIAVDEQGLNVIPVRFTYVTEKTSSNKTNPNFGVLSKIMANGMTWLEHGKEKATKIKCNTSFGLNEFYTKDTNELVSQMIQEGGFISFIDALPEDIKERNSFFIDLLMNGITRKEADPEKDIPNDYCVIKGACFNFRKALMPMTFVMKNQKGMETFESYEPSSSNPIFIKVWGTINFETKKVRKVEESSFGEAAVSAYDKKIKEWIIVGAAKEPYDFGDESTLTPDEVSKMIQDREVHLADLKKRSDEYRNKVVTPTATNIVAPAAASNKEYKF